MQFLAADEWIATQPRLRRLLSSRLGWRELAAGGLDVRPLLAGHGSILAEPAVAELAAPSGALLPCQAPAEIGV